MPNTWLNIASVILIRIITRNGFILNLGLGKIKSEVGDGPRDRFGPGTKARLKALGACYIAVTLLL